MREITVALFVGVLSELATVPAFRCELREHADTYFPHDAKPDALQVLVYECRPSKTGQVLESDTSAPAIRVGDVTDLRSR